MGAGQTFFQAKQLTASAVVAGNATDSQNTGGKQSVLHGIAIGSIAATAVVSIYDDTQTASPVAGNLRYQITAAAAIAPTTILLDIVMNNGIAVVIATAAANITVLYR